MKCAAQGHTVVYVELWLAPKLTVLIPEEWQEGCEQQAAGTAWTLMSVS